MPGPIKHWYEAQNCMVQVLVQLVACLGTLFFVTGLGGLVFSGFESKKELELNGEYIDFMNALNAQLNGTVTTSGSGNATVTVTGADMWTTLTENYLTAPGNVKNGWGFESFSAFLFSFELLTTIGYGEIAPKTVGGRLWLCVFSLATIPLGGVCLSKIASCVIDLIEWGVQVLGPEQKALFRAFDTDGDRLLCPAEARRALISVIGREVDDADFHDAYAYAHVLQRNPVGLSLAEFCRMYSGAANPMLQHRRRWRKLYVSSLAVCIWLVIGMFAFNHFEQWGHMPSFYFCFVTLTTVGLGDFYPTTEGGESFHFFYCVTGLGIVAVLLTAISDVASEDSITPEEEVEQIASLMSAEFPGVSIPTGAAAAALAAKGGANGPPPPPPKDAAKREAERVKVSMQALARLDGASKERVLRALLAESRQEQWFYTALSPYMPATPLPVAQPPPPPLPPPQQVIKVFGPEFPTARGPGASGNASAGVVVPAFKPSYTQLYDDEPYNLSGAPKPGFPLFDDLQFRNTLTGRGTTSAYDGDALDVSHGPYEQDDGLVGQVLGQLSMPARGSAGDGGWGVGLSTAGGVSHAAARRAATRGYNGPDEATLGDDGQPWEAGRGGGERPRGTQRYREVASNRL